jgi:hypothetical protein
MIAVTQIAQPHCAGELATGKAGRAGGASRKRLALRAPPHWAAQEAAASF